MLITLPQLLYIMPGARLSASTFLSPLNAAFACYAIDNPKRLAACLAQIGHESGTSNCRVFCRLE